MTPKVDGGCMGYVQGPGAHEEKSLAAAVDCQPFDVRGMLSAIAEDAL